MTTTRTRLGTISLIAALAAVSAGCDDAAESGIEGLIESQGGGDVELDLSGDGDGFSIQTEDGGMTIDEDGNFVITDESGNTIVGSADDQGNVVVEGEDGSFSASGDEGEFNMETEDGSFRMEQGDEIPAEWPSDVPLPDGLSIGSSTVMQTDDGDSVMLSGSTDSLDEFLADYTAALSDAGFESESTIEFSGEGTFAAVFEGPTGNVVLTASAFPGEDPIVGINVLPPNN